MTDQEKIDKLTEQNDKFREELARLYGIDRPFICGTAGSIDESGNPDFVLVCPAYGSDDFVMYKKFQALTGN